MGSCYAPEYRVPGTIEEFTSYQTPYKLFVGKEKPLWLAVKNVEPVESIEGGGLHISFPQSIRVRAEKPWVYLGSRSNYCYVDFQKILYSNGAICLDPIFITPTSVGPVDIEFSVPNKDHVTSRGTFQLQVE